MLGKIIKAAIALAITSTFIGGIVAGSFRTMIGASFWRTVAANTVLLGLNYLTTKGSNNTTARNLGTPQAFTNPIAARNTVYGKTRVGGTIVYRDVSLSTKELRQIIAVAAHEINDIKKIFLNNGNETFELSLTTDFSESSGVYTITNTNFVNSDNDDAYGSGGLVKVIYEKGDQTTVNSAIQTAIGSSTWTNDHKLQGIAYIYISCIFDAEKWKGYPTFSFEIEGKKVYDPRTATTVYSTNPALIIRDYLKDTTYGFGAFNSEINDATTGAGFIKAANDCDDDVTLTAGTEDRYTLNGEYTASEEPQKVLETMLSSCAGQLTYNNGKFNLFVGKERTASGTITDDKLLAPVQITTKASATSLVNGVKASYVNPDNKYQATEITPYQDSNYLSEDTPTGEPVTNYEKFMNLSFPYTHTTTTAQRLARIALDYARQDQVLSVVVPIEFMTHQVGDIINLTNDRLGYSGKDFEITSMSFEFIEDNYLALRLNLKEYSTTIFDNISYTEDPTLPDDPDAGDNTVPAPTGLTLTEITKTPSFGDIGKQFYIRANWTNASDEKIAATEVAYKKSTDTVFVAKSVAYGTTRITESAESDTTYNFKVRHISAEGVAGDYTSVVNITTSDAQGEHKGGTVGGVTVGTDKIYIGTGTFNNTNTAFYVDDTGQFSLKDKLSWDGTDLTIDGDITATTGTIGGFSIGNNFLTAGSATSRIKLSTADGIHMGNDTFALAPFNVTKSGQVTATDLILKKGNVTYFDSTDGFSAEAIAQIASSLNTRVQTFAFSSENNTDYATIETTEDSQDIKLVVRANASSLQGSGTSEALAIAEIPDNLTIKIEFDDNTGFTSPTTIGSLQTYNASTDGTPLATEYEIETLDLSELGGDFSAFVLGNDGAVNASGDIVYTVSSYTVATAGTYYFRVIYDTTDTTFDATNDPENFTRSLEIEDLSGSGFLISNGSSGSQTSDAVTLTGTQTISGAKTFSATTTFSGDVNISGDLSVSGTTTTIDTATLNVEDKNITLNYSTGDSSSTADGAGITIQDAVNSTTDATITWDATNDEFDFSHGIVVNGTSTGSDFLSGLPAFTTDKYIYTKGIINEGETGSAPAGIVFGNGSTYGNDQISLITSGNTAVYIGSNSITTFNYQANFNDWVYVDVAGQNLVLQSDTSTRETIEWKQGSTRYWTLDLEAGGDLNFDPEATTQAIKINGTEFVDESRNVNAGTVTATSFSGDGSGLTNLTTTTINSNADNRIITGSGTADTLNAEANLTYDGNILKTIGTNATLTVQVDATSGQDALLELRGARTSSSTNDIAKIKFDNKTTSAYTMAEITARDPSGSHTLGRGSLIFRTSAGGTLSDALLINQDKSATFYDNVTLTAGALSVTTDSDNVFRNATDNDLGHVLRTSNASDYAGHWLKGKDGNEDKFLIGYGSTHSTQPNELALKNNNSSGKINFWINATNRLELTSGGNLLQDGTYHLIGTDSGDAFNANAQFRGQSTGASYVQLKVGASSSGGILIGDSTDDFRGGLISYMPSHATLSNKTILFTNNTEVLTAQSNGNVGVGTTGPQSKFHVYDASINGLIRLESGDSEANIVFEDSSTTDTVNIGCNGDDLKLRTDEGNITFFTGTAGTAIERAKVQSDGTFRIGNSSSAGLLVVSETNDTFPTIAPSTKAIFASDNTTAYDAGISLIAPDDVSINFGDYNDEDAGAIIYKNSDDSMRFNTATGERMVMASSGDISFAGDLKLDSANAEINIKQGITGTIGAINWTFNTDSTNYVALKMPYDSRASVGFHIDSNYPITVDGTTAVNFSLGAVKKAYVNGSQFNIGAGSFNGRAMLSIQTSSNTADRGISFQNSGNAFSNSIFVEDVGGNDARLVFTGGNANTSVTSLSRDFMINNQSGGGGVSGDIHARGDVVAFSSTVSSDERLKYDIEDIKNPLDIIQSLKGRHFKWKKNDQQSSGVIAQEVEQSEMSFLVSDKVDIENPDETIKRVKYDGFIGVLIEAIKEQQKQIDELKAKLK